MIRTAFLAVLALAALASNAEARQRHKTHVAHPDCNVTMPCEGVAPSPRGEAIARDLGFGSAQKVYKPAKRSQNITQNITVASFGLAKPARYIGGRLVCAINVNAALAERGIRGTGSALAKSFLRWGRSAGGPVPGAVIVSSRRGGGHVAIVSRVENGVVYAWNATGGRRGWREIAYRKAVIDYRVPG